MENNIITGETFNITGRGLVFLCKNCTFDIGDTFEYEAKKYLIRGIEIQGYEEKPYDIVGLLVREIFWEESYTENGYSKTKGIKLVSSERIISVAKTEEGIQFMEECDGVYSHTYSKKDALRLIQELKNYIEDE